MVGKSECAGERGRTSESAEVQSDVGPDRTAAGTDWVKQRVPCAPGLPVREQHRRGRANLCTTSFEVFVRNIRELLVRSLGAGGFDAARDIAAITVNRWPHGYGYVKNTLFDGDEYDKTLALARQPSGRVAIANSDSEGDAYAHLAIDAAARAVRELMQ